MGLVGGKRENGFRRVRQGVGGGFGASSRLPGGTWDGLWVAGWGRRGWLGRPVGWLTVAEGDPLTENEVNQNPLYYHLFFLSFLFVFFLSSL